MKVFGFNISRTPQIVDVDKKQPQRTKVLRKTVTRQLIRAKQDISKWRSAINIAESTFTPDRTELIRIYKDTILDSHLSSLMETRKINVKSMPCMVVDANGDNDPDQGDKIKQEWFYKFIDIAMDSLFYGFEVIQLGDIVDDSFPHLERVKHEYVVPEKHYVKPDLYVSTKGVRFDQPPFDKWTIWVGQECDLGLLNKATPLAIWKKNAFGAWAIRADLFGMPLRVGHTDIRNPDSRDNMEEMLKNMDIATWGLFDVEDKVEFVESSGADGHKIYNELVDRANSEMSKLILGQTMTADDGSSRSQAEVHERVADKYTQSDLRFIENVINNKLFPLMVFHGMLPDGVKFQFDRSEHLSLMDKWQIDKELINTFEVPQDYIEQTYGTPVGEAKTSQAQPFSNIAQISAMYKDSCCG